MDRKALIEGWKQGGFPLNDLKRVEKHHYLQGKAETACKDNDDLRELFEELIDAALPVSVWELCHYRGLLALHGDKQ